MKGFCQNVPFLVVTGGEAKKFCDVTHSNTDCALYPTEIFCSGRKRERWRKLSEIRKYNIATNRVNYLQSISFGK